jgi:hypothetical protein
MKKTYKQLKLPVAAFAALFLAFSAQSAHALGLGIPFGFGNNTTFGSHGGGTWGADFGARLHFTDMVAVQPNLSIGMGGDDVNLGINIDVLFYLFENNGIQQYIGPSVGFNVTDGDSNFRLGFIYGLQHPIADAVDIFGQVGLGTRFDPFRLFSVNTQLGVIFYIMK